MGLSRLFKAMSLKSDAMKALVFVILLPCFTLANVTPFKNSIEDARINLLIDLIALNLKSIGWNNIIIYGKFPDSFYSKIKIMPFTFTTSNIDEDDFYVEDIVRYHSNTILINCSNFTNFEESLRQVMNLPYWHPHANIIIIYHKKESKQDIARIFFSLWYYKASNAILVQYNDTEKLMFISQYNPFVVDDSWDIFGCWTVRKIGMPIINFEEGFVCEEKCHNVSITSNHRHLRLGTCIGLQTLKIQYDNRHELIKLNLFEDRCKNMNGFTLRAFTTEVAPFLIITKLENGTYELGSRDGMIWNTLAKLMNFSIYLIPSDDLLKTFSFELNIQQIFYVANRKGDLFLLPVYQFDIIVVDIDYTFAFKESGVCFMSHKAPFETVLFDLNTLQDNIERVIEFFSCVLCIWLVYFLYSVLETGRITIDLIGKSFMNTVRSALSITLYKPPKRRTFRYFLTVILWCFFVINFSTQAAIISFFTAFKRGKEVETFADIVDKGYNIYGMSSPDVVLPDDNELFQKINSKLEPINDIFGCLKDMTNNDSHRFCLIDCAMGRYLERNLLNAKGEQYLHITQDRVHNYYLNFIFPKYSTLTDSVNKYLMAFYEAGLVKKWEPYRLNDIKLEAPTKPLGMEDFKGIFEIYFGLVSVTFIIFILELMIGNYKIIKQQWSLKVKHWKRTRIARRTIQLEKKQNQIMSVSSSTQT